MLGAEPAPATGRAARIPPPAAAHDSRVPLGHQRRPLQTSAQIRATQAAASTAHAPASYRLLSQPQKRRDQIRRALPFTRLTLQLPAARCSQPVVLRSLIV